MEKDLEFFEIFAIIGPLKSNINTSKSSEKDLFTVIHAVFRPISPRRD